MNFSLKYSAFVANVEDVLHAFSMSRGVGSNPALVRWHSNTLRQGMVP